MNTGTMKNVLHSNNWSVGVVEQHVEIPPIPLIKSKHDYKSDKDFIKLKFVGIQHQKSWTSITLKWHCSKKAVQKSFVVRL